MKKLMLLSLLIFGCEMPTQTNNDDEYIENYNAAPTNRLPAITNKNSNKIKLLQWGLIPYWSKKSEIGGKLINARLETVFDKPSFKQIIRNKRCAIIADGYYEWMRVNLSKQPYYIYFKGHKPFMFALSAAMIRAPGKRMGRRGT